LLFLFVDEIVFDGSEITAIPFSNAANVYTNRKHRGFSILKV